MKFNKYNFWVLTLLLFTFMGSLGYCTEEDAVVSGKLTYGMAKKHIKVGETTQADVVKLFGSPDNMTMRKGKETWIYDKFRVESESSSTAGFGTLLVVGASETKSKSSTRTKTITIVVDFNDKGIVEDYSRREGGY
jgi:outer membrane protein assembly factor BamE (lipoprotein component of BamABCDE complex)